MPTKRLSSAPITIISASAGRFAGSPGVNDIHHGADDNASGTAALIEVARQLAVAREKTAAARLCSSPSPAKSAGCSAVPAMFASRSFRWIKPSPCSTWIWSAGLHDNKLIVYGNGTAAGVGCATERFNEKFGFDITRHPEGVRAQRSFVVLRQANSGAAFLHRHAQRLSPPHRHGRQNQRRRHGARDRIGHRHRRGRRRGRDAAKIPGG